MIVHVLRRCAGVLALAAVVGLLAYKAQAQGPSGEWINVRDCGASGSQYETTAATTEGSKQITVANVGDLKVGQGVTVSKCFLRYYGQTLWGPGAPYYNSKPLGDAMEIRGYDGSIGWRGYVLVVDSAAGANPVTLRWSDDLARTWKQNKVPITGDWQPLSGGIEVRFGKTVEWQPGHLVTFGANDQLVGVIQSIEGNVLTLDRPANKTGKDAVVRHNDQVGIQAAIRQAIKEKKNVYIPAGRYCLTHGMGIREAAITIEGDGWNTVLDISNGEGPCFTTGPGQAVTIRKLAMVGHTGMKEAAPPFTTASGCGFWAMCLQSCSAVGISRGPDHLLVEDVQVRRMSSECFYSGGSLRGDESKPYVKSITYHRVTVEDCGFNAFNNNDLAENTNILYCRVRDIGGSFWEGPSRYLRFIGNYCRNSDGFSIGNQSKRHDDNLQQLGCGQAVVADNVIEGADGKNGGIRVAHGATQVVIANNLFINFNGNAIQSSSMTWKDAYPAGNVIIKGNIVDLTWNGEKPRSRTGIDVSTSDTIVHDNQVYVRGACDPKVTGIRLSDPAINVNIHDNIVRNCGSGLVTGRLLAKVTEVVNPTTFLQDGVPYQWRYSDLYRGWNLVWLVSGRPTLFSTIASYDPDTTRFTLAQPHDMKPGDRFEVFPPGPTNWNIHDNTITACTHPVVLDSYGSETAILKNNTIARGDATGVQAAIEVRGRFQLIGNHITAFDEKDSSALALFADRIGRTYRNIYRDNVFDRCTNLVAEDHGGLYRASDAGGNLVVGQPSRP